MGNIQVMDVPEDLHDELRRRAAPPGDAVGDLARMPVERVSDRLLARAAWRLRARMSVDDACYVALAQTVGGAVVTTDARWTRSGDLGVTVIVASPPAR